MFSHLLICVTLFTDENTANSLVVQVNMLEKLMQKYKVILLVPLLFFQRS